AEERSALRPALPARRGRSLRRGAANGEPEGGGGGGGVPARGGGAVTLEINERLAIPDAELTFTFARSGGPGGQNVNKVSSKAVLRWDLAANTSLPEEVKARLRGQERRRVTTEGELVITSQTYRDQERNKQECLDRLVEMVRRALLVPKPRKAT